MNGSDNVWLVTRDYCHSLEARLEIHSDDFGTFLLGCVDQKHIRRNIKKTRMRVNVTDY